MTDPAKTEDFLLWNGVGDSDEAAFNTLMHRHYKSLFRYGIRIHADEDLVRDAIQEVFISVWERRHKLPEIDSPRSYLLGSLRKRILYELRQSRWERLDEMADQFHVDFSFDHGLISREEDLLTRQKIETFLNSLPPRQKEIIHLRFYQNLSCEEIADVMKMNRQSVYNLLHETLRRLRRQWGPVGVYLLLSQLHESPFHVF